MTWEERFEVGEEFQRIGFEVFSVYQNYMLKYGNEYANKICIFPSKRPFLGDGSVTRDGIIISRIIKGGSRWIGLSKYYYDGSSLYIPAKLFVDIANLIENNVLETSNAELLKSHLDGIIENAIAENIFDMFKKTTTNG